MALRPLSWFPLASADPVPGDPATVELAGQHYGRVAEAISSAAQQLREIASLGGSTSKAVDAVRETAEEVAGKISRAHDRYQEVGSALTAYATELRQAQADSLTALNAATNAQQAVDAAAGDVRGARQAIEDVDPAAPADPTAAAARQTALSGARDRLDDADAALEAARQDLQAAVELRDTAASTAISAIEGIIGSDDLNDGWWEDWGSKVAHALSAVAGAIASVAGILALVLCWVPVLGQALAAVALIAGVVKLAADVALKMNGEGSWGDIIWGVVGVASFGVGRVVGTTARLASRGAQGVARLDAGRLAATSIASRTAAGLPSSGSSASVINQLVGTTSGALTRNQARTLAGQLDDVGRFGSSAGWQSLRPGAVFSDVRAGFDVATDAAARSRVFSEGGAALSAAGGSARAQAAAMAGDGDLVAAIAQGTARVDGALQAAAPTTAQALATAGSWQSANAVAVGYGTYDQWMGAKNSFDMLVLGEDFEPPIADSYQWIVDAFEDSPAEQLGLR